MNDTERRIYARVDANGRLSNIGERVFTFDDDVAMDTIPGAPGEHYLAEAMSLSAMKQTKINEIDTRSEELIAAGFEFDGRVFSLSQNAQNKWNGLQNSINAGIMTFPYRVPTKDDLGSYSIPDATIGTQMFGTALGRVASVLLAGTDLTDLVRAATNQAEIDAVVDDRT